MRVYSLAATDQFPSAANGGAVSIGNFDGVHRGHAALVKQLHKRARALGGPAVAVTFDPHPLRLLAPEQFMPQLTTAADRADYLLVAGADRVVILQTTPELLALEPREFLDRTVRDQLQARFIVEGFNFQFGRNREGNMDLLDKWCHAANVGLDLVPAFALPGDVPVSSSRVRFALNAGDVAKAAELLGRPYRLRGKVVVGERRGASLGFPTANLAECLTVIPGDGVYAARAVTESGGAWPAAVNIGPNPTFGVTTRKIEAHLIGFTGDLYHQSLAIDFVSRLRDTMTFASRSDLIEQLRHDAHRAANEVSEAA